MPYVRSVGYSVANRRYKHNFGPVYLVCCDCGEKYEVAKNGRLTNGAFPMPVPTEKRNICDKCGGVLV